MKKIFFVLFLTGCVTNPPQNMTPQQYQMWLYEQQRIQKNLDDFANQQYMQPRVTCIKSYNVITCQ